MISNSAFEIELVNLYIMVHLLVILFIASNIIIVDIVIIQIYFSEVLFGFLFLTHIS